MAIDLRASERRWLWAVYRLPLLAAFVLGVVSFWLWIAKERQEATLPPPAEDRHEVILNEATCASTRCHVALEEAPATSRHGAIACVTCHDQRRGHADRCVECHSRAQHHAEDAAWRSVAIQEMARVREEMERQHTEAENRSEGGTATLREAAKCVTCHLQMDARPVTFPQVALATHLPDDKTADDCMDCHRPHDPKPMLGHPIPEEASRKGRDGCLACHRDADDGAETAVIDLDDHDGLAAEFRAWAAEEFPTSSAEIPLVPGDHGHGTVACIACHGAPPGFHDVASRVHGLEEDVVRCGKCHLGSTIIDQVVLAAKAQAVDQPIEPPGAD